jgi:hypothetical protein
MSLDGDGIVQVSVVQIMLSFCIYIYALELPRKLMILLFVVIFRSINLEG